MGPPGRPPGPRLLHSGLLAPSHGPRDLRRALGQAPNATALTGSSKNRLLPRPSLPGRVLQSGGGGGNTTTTTEPRWCHLTHLWHEGLQFSFAGSWDWTRGDGVSPTLFSQQLGESFSKTQVSSPLIPPTSYPGVSLATFPDLVLHFCPRAFVHADLLVAADSPTFASGSLWSQGLKHTRLQPQLTLRFSSPLPPSPPFPPSSLLYFLFL